MTKHIQTSKLKGSILVKGFSLLELVLALGLIGIIFNWFNIYYQKQHLTKVAHILAGQTKLYGADFAAYIKASGNDSSVSYAQLVGLGYIAHNSRSTNKLGQTPCLINDGYNWYMVYVGGHVGSLKLAQGAMLDLGGYAGYVDNGLVLSNGSWSIDTMSNPAFANLATKCSAPLTPNSLVLNLSFNSFDNPNNNNIDLHLQRTEDKESKVHGLTTVQNTNTQRADILLDPNASIKFDYRDSNFAIFQQESNLISLPASNTLTANNLYATKHQVAGDACQSNELGDIKTQNVNLAVSLTKSKLVCTYSPLLCQARTGGDYCYLSSQANTMALNNNSNNITNAGFMGYKYLCPNSTSIAVGYAANVQTLNINYLTCGGSVANPICNSVSQPWQKTFSPNELGSEFITGNNSGYTVKLGAQVFPYNTNSCSDNCAALLNLDRSVTGHASISSGSCICSSDKQNATYKVVNSYSTALGALRAMACTSQVTVDAK